MKIEPGTLCLVIKSIYGNEGREVVALRTARPGGHVAEYHSASRSEIAGWVVRAKHPLRRRHNPPGADPTVGVIPAAWLLPLAPPPGTVTERTAEPVAAS